MSDVLRAGIIGCGGIARSHLKGYSNNEIEVTAVADINSQSLEAFVAETGGAARPYSDSQTLIDSGLVDLVSICTPPVAHAEAAVYALERGIHVLCEKPLANDAESARRIRDAAVSSEALCMMAFRHRFIDANVQMKRMIEDGRIGTPVLFQNVFGGPAFAMEEKWFTKREISGGGCLLDTSSHSVDLFRFFFGEIMEHHAVIHRHFPNTDVEDAGVLSLRSERGVLGTICSSFVLGDAMAFIDITGQAGRLRFDYARGDEVRYVTRDGEWETIPVKETNGVAEEIGSFLTAIQDGSTPEVTVKDGWRCQEIIQTHYR